MKISLYEESNVRCPACMGQGRVTPMPSQWLAIITDKLKTKRVDLKLISMLGSGVCIICEGKGWCKQRDVVATAHVSVWGWFKNWLTGWLPNEIRNRASGRPSNSAARR